MKVRLSHLLMVLLLVIILSALGLNIKEGMGPRRREHLEENEHLYALKSSMVPPICPKCPDAAVCPRQKPCPPCPPCARCPEPAFRCKKVPNYFSRNEQYLPLPMLNSFSSFK